MKIKYRLKDKERQQALEKVLPGFSEALENGDTYYYPTLITMEAHKGKDDYWSMSLPKKWTEQFEEYDPSRWNDFPEVTPPDGVLMCVEVRRENRKRFLRFCAIFLAGAWYDPNPESQPQLVGQVLRFRPWDDAPEP